MIESACKNHLGRKTPLLSSFILGALAFLPVACGQADSPPGSDAELYGESELAIAAAPSLGTAQSFAVLGGSTVTNTGATTIKGDLGVSPGLAITGFPPGTVAGGTIHAGDATAAQAQADLTVAYDSLAADACDTDLTGQDLGGLTLTPGVYCFSSSAQLTGTLTLDALGDPNAVFIFQIGSTLTTASNASVVMKNSAQKCKVFWQIGSSATLGTGTSFVGSILALTSITLTTGASVAGRALARNGAVTMDQNSVTAATCGASACMDRVTGYLLSSVGSTPTDISFNVWASLVSGVLAGGFCYRDATIDMHVHTTLMTSYTVLSPTTRLIQGQGTINGVPGYTYAITVTDNGATDSFTLTLSDGYTFSGTLPANNVQVTSSPGCP